MITAIIGMIYAVLFLLLGSVIVAVFPTVLCKKKMTFEGRMVVETILWSLCSVVVLLLNLEYFLLNSFAYAALLISGMKIVALPVLVRLKQTNRRKYIVLKRLMRKV